MRKLCKDGCSRVLSWVTSLSNLSSQEWSILPFGLVPISPAPILPTPISSTINQIVPKIVLFDTKTNIQATELAFYNKG